MINQRRRFAKQTNKKKKKERKKEKYRKLEYNTANARNDAIEEVSRSERCPEFRTRENVARYSGKNPPMQKYVQEELGGGREGGTREPWRRGRLTWMASGV